jgi:hypothetical protein
MKTSAIVGVLVAIVAATLWFWSSRIKVQFGGYGGLSPEDQRKLRLQARLNSGAAMLTGVATLLQAFAATAA